MKLRPFSATTSRMASIQSSLGVRTVRTLRQSGAQLVRVTDGKTFDEQYAKNLVASGIVEYLEPNYILHAFATPNDTDLNRLWGMHNSGQTGGTVDADIDAPEAWNITTGSDQVVVGVVDTGIDSTHPDLQQNIWRNSGEIPGNGRDDDGNGFIDDVYGMNAIVPASPPSDDNGHGTHCAGTIGAAGNNGRGVVGVNWNVKLMALKFLDGSGSGTLADAVEAIDYATMMKNRGVNVRVLSNSWGGGSYSQALEDSIRRARDAGILFVAAAGNESNDNDENPAYPASYDVENVISVAAIDHGGNVASFSNYGQYSVHVAAPGVSIYSTQPGGRYQTLSGTSMATPHVSGVAALVAGHQPALSVTALAARLKETVKPLPTLAGVVRSGGMVDAFNALTDQRAPGNDPQPEVSYRVTTTADGYDNSLGSRVLSVDDGYYAHSLPFPVTFYGVQFSRIAISSNGRIIPLGDGQTVPTTADFANRLLPGINVYSDDLVPVQSTLVPQGGVWVRDSGDEVRITWVATSYAHRTSTNPLVELRVQAVLNRNGTFDFHYHDTSSGDAAYDAGASATVGLAPIGGGNGPRLQVSHNTPNPAQLATGKALHIDVSSQGVINDFDGDRRSDPVVWRPSLGLFIVALSGKSYAEQRMYQLGLPGDRPFIVDTDGDDLADVAVWRPSTGTWYFRTSRSNYEIVSQMQWGLPTDRPVAFRADGDSITDIGVFRDGVGYLILLSGGGFDRSGALRGESNALGRVSMPWPGHDPVQGYFKSESVQVPAVVFQLRRFWTMKQHTGATDRTLDFKEWGEPGDTPCPFDYNGNKIDDQVMVRPTSGGTMDWWIRTESDTYHRFVLGSAGDTPLCGRRDYNGDGKTDPAAFHDADGVWTIRNLTNESDSQLQFGLPGDIPL